MTLFTKIICTLGPSTDTPEMINELILAGMTAARLNFSHGSQEEHARRIAIVREESKKLKTEVAIIADLQGPKIRTNRFIDGAIQLLPNQEVRIEYGEHDGKPGLITTKFEPLVRDAHPGDRILLDDGLIELMVTRVGEKEIACRVIFGGTLRDRKGINLPSTKLNIPSLTQKDLEDVQFALQQDIDFVALSFVRSAADIRRLREVISFSGKTTRIIAKIEKPEALADLDNILHCTDAIMIARGDLAVEIGNERVPGVQKDIIRQCLTHGIPVITATQMLESMITNPRPTRAEASDVANAIYDGTDALMLSGETAAGKFPIEAVRMMQTIALETEKQTSWSHFDDWNILDSSHSRLGMSIGKTACLLVRESGAKALGCLSHTGKAAIRLTCQRPRVPVFMFSANLSSVRTMNIVRSAFGILIDQPLHVGTILVDMEQKLLEMNLIAPGDLVVYTAGMPSLMEATTNTIHIRAAAR